MIPLPPAPVVLLAGPTASGKSALALDWARSGAAEIVNADSQQLYRDLRVLSARPGPEEAAQAPHHLYGVADGEESWSVGRWLRAVLPVLADIRRRGRTAIVTGGTGLYFQALTRGLAEIPNIAPEVAEAADRDLDRFGETAFRARLTEVDAAAAGRIASGDRQRLGRAWAVWKQTGRALSDWRGDTRPPLEPGDWSGLVVELPRDRLYARCDARVAAMVEQGALEEVWALSERRLSGSLPVMRALGVGPFAEHLSGRSSLAEAAARVRTDTRRYAKRQLTWFRNQTPDWPRLTPDV